MTSFGQATLRSSTSAVALGFFMTGTAAFADVTAQDVWADWKGYFAGSGYTMSAEETLSGDTLSVKNIVMSMEIPEEDANIRVELGEIDFVEKGDGTVSVEFPASIPLNIVVDGPEAVTIAMDYNNTGLVMNVSGDPNDITYNYTAAEIALKFKEIVAEGQSIDLGVMDVTVADIVGTTTMKVGDLRVADQKMTSGPVSYNIDFKDPENEDARLVLKGGLAGMDATGTSTLPLEMDAALMHQAVANGFAVDADLSYRENAMEFQFTEGAENVQGTTSSNTGQIKVAMSDKGLIYDVSTTDTNVSMAGGEIPFPVEFALEEAGFKFGMPIIKGEEEQDFAFGFTMGNFTMSDLIWGIFDPTGQLPRDPATIAIDMTGKAKLFFDFLNPEEMENVETSGEMPGELNSLSLNSLTVRAAGAELTGGGAFTFDNSDLETFDGVPAPDGTIDLKLVGANALLDTLVSMGFVPEDQAMGARMMMGLFAVPGDGEDTLNSTIEVKSDGQVLANGQRLR
ncbi:DUF2125 domain-containing protein [Roseovarius phycicola]|uniref:DUF2125 domain-containing protein n=1 Tax=Roseovarius phycicola TaxID=3080976 RepID=A0ABZ2HGF2_9RHOB